MNKNKNQTKNSSAFTIVELLIVIVIIGVLAAITIVSYTGITKRAGESSVQAELSNASKKLAIYYTLNGTYPTNIDQSTGCPTAPTPDNNNCIKFGSDTSFSYDFKTSSTYNLYATKGIAAYQITESTGPVVFVSSFVKAWSGTATDYGYDLVQTSDGGYAVTGYTASFGAGNNDMLIAKYDASGNLSWNKLWGGTGSEYGYDLVQTSDGGYAVTGYVASYGAGSDDMFLAKYDSSGNLSWNKTWGGTGAEYGYDLVQTSDGGYAVTGSTNSYGAGNTDMFLAKYNSSGNLSWNKTWGGTGVDNGKSLAQTSDGGYAVTGYVASYGAGDSDTLLVKYDASGNLSWNKTWGGTATEYGESLVQTRDGGYAVTGYTTSFGAGNYDILIAKYDSSGNLSWNKTWGGASGDQGYSIIQTSDGGYALTGYTYSYGAGNYDMLLAKYDASGNLSWSKTWGGTAAEYGESLIQTSDGGYAITGHTRSYGSTSGNVFLTKINSSGTINNCFSPMCQSPTATVTAPSATITTPTATITAPSATITTPTVTVTDPTATITTVVAP